MTLERLWYGRSALRWLLAPLSALFWTVSTARRAAYRWGLLRSVRLPVPVLVVGNLSAGGTGKTPLVIWLAGHLQGLGRRPGILSRGYGGASDAYPRLVAPDSDPAAVGDEPLLLSRRAGCPVVVDPDRVRGGRRLVEREGCDVLIADDGLQHYRLARDLEIAVIDGRRRLGNGWVLPAGPLRETASRLRSVDLVVVNGDAAPGELAMRLVPSELVSVEDPARRRPLESLAGQTVHAVAGIGNPERFFALLRSHGAVVEGRAFPDHHRFHARDIEAPGDEPVIMTEKDAVKCERFAGARHWMLPVEAVPDPQFAERLDRRLTELLDG
ncbi:MAG: tetraacyldisaccharide 4'-kinase [Gammaproteobacteria bacterium]|nr:tetraacyldisaccharide 4'-kinase [Gammaproteobacteria bacterium]